MNKTLTTLLPVLMLALLATACKDRADGIAADPAAATEEHGGEEDADGHGVLTLSPQARKAAGLVIAEAGAARIAEVIPLYGVLKPNAEALRSVAARFPGVVRSVSATIGQSVKAGAVLATVESNESLQVYAVTSPLEGIVTERFTNVGEQAGTNPLFTVVNLSTLWAELSLFPRDRNRIRVGQTVSIRVTDVEQNVTGRVVFISPLGSSASQSLTARVVIDNKNGQLSPGLYVRGDVAVSETDVALAVPVGALQELEGGTSVFVEDAEGLEARVVKIGRTDGKYVEILEGLSPGERIVIEGSFVLKAELGKGEAEHEH